MYLGSPRQIPSISIHAPREGSDAWGGRPPGRQYRFLSTLPVRGATFSSSQQSRPISLFLSTLPVRGATYQVAHWLAHILISIHAPREGSDLMPSFFHSWKV